MDQWQREREELGRRVAAVRDRGLCPTCHDLETGELFSSADRLLYEDDDFHVVLERFPRMRGHTIIVYKPHREDISELRDDEAESVMSMCLRVIRALKSALGAEKVYVNTMCDGLPNHFHLQLFPRYAGDETASKRFVLSRSGLTQAGETASLVRAALSG